MMDSPFCPGAGTLYGQMARSKQGTQSNPLRKGNSLWAGSLLPRWDCIPIYSWQCKGYGAVEASLYDSRATACARTPFCQF